jgi:hypothetical protein
MRKLLAVCVVAVGLVAFAGSAYGDVVTGEGKNAPGGPNPVDPTAGYANQAPAGPLFIGFEADADGGGVAIALGDEGQADSVGRLAIFGSATDMTGGMYGEDYTDGDQIANAVRTVNQATGCALVPCGGPNDDAVLGTGP